MRLALQPVLRDIRATGAPEPDIRDDASWSYSAAAMLWGRDGTGMGVSVDPAEPQVDRVARVADQVQEWVIEERWGNAATNWPPCPRHPQTHPLTAAVVGDVATWTCPADGMPISPVGQLR